MEEQPGGLLCRMGQSDLIAGVSRGVIMTISVLGPIIGAMILWWVSDLGSKLDHIDERIAKLFEKVGAIEIAGAGTAATGQSQGLRVDKLEQESQDYDRRITRLEALRGAP